LTRNCKHCGGVFEPAAYNVKRGKGLFCGKSCASEARRYAAPAEVLECDSHLELVLRGGKVAKLDRQDAHHVHAYGGWHFHIGRNERGYVECSKRVRLHRLILGLQKGDRRHIDHINGDTLDNRRANLRLCTAAQNQWNRGPTRDSTSGHKNVFWVKRDRRWIVTIRNNGRRIYVGSFKEKEDAVAAQAAAAVKMQGDFAWRAGRD